MRTHLVACCIALAWAGSCLAQTMEVAPVSVTLSPGQRTASMTITNRGVAPVTIQVRPFRWTEADGTSSLTETTALAVSPPVVEVPPGQAQLVRLLLRNAPDAAEATYRLLIDQLPPAERVNAIRIALRLSVPIFALPDRPAEPDLRWTLETTPSGSFLTVTNRGARHAVITGVQLAAPGAPVSVRTAAHPYVLPGAHVRWPIERNRSWTSPVVLTVQSNTGTAAATATVVSAAP